MFCVSCGKQIDETDSFCRHCGRAAEPKMPAAPIASVKISTKQKGGRVGFLTAVVRGWRASGSARYLALGAVLLLGWIILSNLGGLLHSNRQLGQNMPVAPVAAKPPLPQAMRTPKEQREWENRNLDRAALEQTFLQAGLDVVVGNLVSQGSGDNRSLFIKGEPVNRPFVYNFLDHDAVRILKRDGFTKVTFMRHDMGDWIAEYDVKADKITWE